MYKFTYFRSYVVPTYTIKCIDNYSKQTEQSDDRFDADAYGGCESSVLYLINISLFLYLISVFVHNHSWSTKNGGIFVTLLLCCMIINQITNS